MRPHFGKLRDFLVVAIAFASLLTVSANPCFAFADASSRITPTVRAVQEAKPSVVNIQGRKTVRRDVNDPNSREKMVNGMGTGVVIDPRGYILTNFHVVDGVARIQVSLSDKTTTIARLVAHEPQTDLAIIKIDVDKPLPVIRFGTSSDLMEGETVIALGNAYGYNHSVTEGIISSLHRTVEVPNSPTYYDLIQIDAPINPGNSGGPLMNINGEMIGINVAVRVGAQGIAFAIPINNALDIAANMMHREAMKSTSVGFDVSTVYKKHQPHLVTKYVRDSSTKLRVGDVVEKINGVAASRRLDLERQLVGVSSKRSLVLTVRRGNQVFDTSVKLKGSISRVQANRVIRKPTKAWNVLGVALEKIPLSEFRSISSKYNGGMRVVDVRSNSPAQMAEIQKGDVLIGIIDWETTSVENIQYIMNQPIVRNQPELKYYIIRNGETLVGNLQLKNYK